MKKYFTTWLVMGSIALMACGSSSDESNNQMSSKSTDKTTNFADVEIGGTIMQLDDFHGSDPYIEVILSSSQGEETLTFNRDTEVPSNFTFMNKLQVGKTYSIQINNHATDNHSEVTCELVGETDATVTSHDPIHAVDVYCGRHLNNG